MAVNKEEPEVGMTKSGSLKVKEDDYLVNFARNIDWNSEIRQDKPFMTREIFEGTYAQKWMNYELEELYINENDYLKSGENFPLLQKEENRSKKVRKGAQDEFSVSKQSVREINNGEESDDEDAFLDEYGNVIEKSEAEIAKKADKLLKEKPKDSPQRVEKKSPEKAVHSRLNLNAWKDYDNPDAILPPIDERVLQDRKLPYFFKLMDAVEPRSSSLNGREQSEYIKLMKRFQNRRDNETFSDQDMIAFSNFKSYEDLVRKEQEDYENFAKEMISQKSNLGEVLTPEAKRYAEERMKAQLETVRNLPKLFYPALQKDESMLRMLSAHFDQEKTQMEYEMIFEKELLELGTLSKVFLPSYPQILNNNPYQIGKSYEKVNSQFPAEKLAPFLHQDSNACKLAKVFKPDFVIGIKALQKIFASHQTFEDWILPVTVDKMDDGKLVFFIEEPLIKCSIKTNLEKSQIYADNATKSAVLRPWNYIPPNTSEACTFSTKNETQPRASLNPITDEFQSEDLSEMETFGQAARVDGGCDSDTEDERLTIAEDVNEDQEEEEEEHPNPKRRKRVTRSSKSEKSDDSANEKPSTKPPKKRPYQGFLTDLISSQETMLQNPQKTPQDPQKVAENQEVLQKKYNGEKLYFSAFGDASKDYEEPDEGTNIKFTQWALRPKGSKPEKCLKIIVKTSTDGLRDKDLQIFTLSSKLETQLPFGLEKLTAKELAEDWMATLLRPRSQLARLRIHAQSQSVLNVDIRSLKDLTKDGLEVGFKPAYSLGNLHNLFSGLREQIKSEGQYLLKRDAKNATFVQVLTSKNGKSQKSFNLHAAYTTVSPDLELQQKIQFKPLDMKTLTPFHSKNGRVPGLFNPVLNVDNSLSPARGRGGKRGRGRRRGRGRKM